MHSTHRYFKIAIYHINTVLFVVKNKYILTEYSLEMPNLALGKSDKTSTLIFNSSSIESFATACKFNKGIILTIRLTLYTLQLFYNSAFFYSRYLAPYIYYYLFLLNYSFFDI